MNEASGISIDILDALSYAHEKGIIHRDIKPSNILIDKKGTAFLSDFGIAKALTGETLTTTGSTIGTPEYMSPEQASGKAVDFRSDLYSFGILLYEMLSGDVPFRSDTPVAVAIKHINEAIPDLDKIMPEIPEKVKDLISNLLTKEPSERLSDIKKATNILSEHRDGYESENITLITEPKTVPLNPNLSDDKTAVMTVAKNKFKRILIYLIPTTIAALLIAAVIFGIAKYDRPISKNTIAKNKNSIKKQKIQKLPKNVSTELVKNLEKKSYFLEKTWGSEGSRPGQFFNPSAIDVDSKGRIYITDGGNSRIQIFDQNGIFISELGSRVRGKAQLEFPTDIAIDDKNNFIFIADYQIKKFNLKGVFITKWGKFDINEHSGGLEIDIDAKGNIYASNSLPVKIYKFSNNSKLIKTWDINNEDSDCFEGGNMSVDNLGNIYQIYCEYVIKLGINGTKQIVHAMNSNERGLVGVQTDKENNVYITEKSRENIYYSVYIYTRENKYVKKIELLGNPQEIDHKGNIYTSDIEEFKVRKYRLLNN